MEGAMSKKFHRVLLALALTGLVSGVQAQRPWLLASSTVVDAKDPWVTVDAATSENAFDIDNMPLKLDALVLIGPDGGRVLPVNVFTGHLRSSFDIKLAQPGTYKASLVSTSVMAYYRLNGETKRWRGSEQAFATEMPANAQDVRLTRMHSRLETFVSTGKPNEAVFKPTGEGLEFVPLTHPNDLRVGEKATWRFLLDGKPAANQSFSLVLGGVRYRGVLGEIRKTTDANGEISFTVPGAGMYLLSSNWPETTPPAEGQPVQQPPRRLSYGATLEVLPQ
jgi:uncharacterized GH25 family protein